MIYGRSCHFYYSVLSTSLIIKCWRSKSYSWVFNGSETKTRVHMKTWDFWSKKLLKLVLVLKHSPSSSIFCVKFSSSQQIRNSGLPFVYICFPLIFFFFKWSLTDKHGKSPQIYCHLSHHQNVMEMEESTPFPSRCSFPSPCWPPSRHTLAELLPLDSAHWWTSTVTARQEALLTKDWEELHMFHFCTSKQLHKVFSCIWMTM